MKRIPRSTYRLQFNPGFTFADAENLLGYLKKLGISDLYASPFMMGGPEDLNGYQVTDHSRINPKLGGEEGFAKLVKEMQAHEIGLIADIVPNHMCIATADNVWWDDILENGPASSYAHHFDIDWNPPRAELKNQVLLPILVGQFGRVLEQGDLQVVFGEKALFIDYRGRLLPTNPSTWIAVLESMVIELETLMPAENAMLLELQSILTAVRNLPTTLVKDPDKLEERKRESAIIKQRFGALLSESGQVRIVLDRVLGELNGHCGDPRSFDALEAFLDEQPYRLSFWRVANHEINYRRFFDINDLAGLCVEVPEVFSAVHKLIFRLLARGWVTGLRVDHIDGLFDPEQYLHQLRKETDCYLVVEKVFTGAERLRPFWPVHGTTGYDFLNLLNGVFVSEENRNKVRNAYFDFGGWHQDPFQLVYYCKWYALSLALASEWHVLARHLDRLSEQNRGSRDFTLDNLQQALGDVIACFPVYRSYIRAQGKEVSEEDRSLVLEAVRRARRLNPTTSPLIYDFIQSVLLLEDPPGLTKAQIIDRRAFVTRFQQLSGPVMAKGVEDTAFYRSYPLTSLNEVGGNPYIFGTSVDTFHWENAYRLKHWPHAMITTATHDTKRSEDVRARINVLSEIPEQWEQALIRWRQANEQFKTELEGEIVPGGNEEYLFYQAVVGAFPLRTTQHLDFVDRIEAYMGKATKEAKVYTSWVNPNELYDELLKSFIRQALEPKGPFLRDLQAFLPVVVRPGLYNSLAQVVMKLASPGVPDFYQGTELWDFSLVDPDNRRPVDYSGRPALLDQLLNNRGGGQVAELRETLETGHLKIYLTALGLQLRQKRASLFAKGCYTPSEASGARADQVIGFSRCYEGQVIVAAVGRFFTRFSEEALAEAWGDTMLTMPPGEYQDIYTQETYVCRGELPVQELFSHLPLCLLESVG